MSALPQTPVFKFGNKPVLFIEQVCELVAMPRASVYQNAKNGHFPEPVNIGKKRFVWVESDVLAWIDTRLNARSNAANDAANDKGNAQPPLPKRLASVHAEVLARLLRGEAVTGLDAWIKSGTSRLAAIIFNLRRDGWRVIDVRESVATSDGRTASIARYSLENYHQFAEDELIKAFIDNVFKARDELRHASK